MSRPFLLQIETLCHAAVHFEAPFLKSKQADFHIFVIYLHDSRQGLAIQMLARVNLTAVVLF